ncbi:MAG: hypothetical protein IKD23_06430 [Lentisphaeria bacterium]|nr:hypothetical protein [Lentisphaeria bacterium]
MSKKSFLLACLLAVGVSASAGVFELFDSMPINGRLRTGAELIKPAGQDGLGAMKITGNGKGAQYGYSYGFTVEPGKEYGMSFAYQTSPKFTTMLVMVNFGDAKKKIDPKLTKTFRIANTNGEWKHRQIKVTAPAGAAYGEMVIRFINVPKTAYAIIDNFRWADLTGEKNFFNARKLDTIFDDWRFLGQQHFEHYILGKSAKVVMEWKKAKAGESFLQINGDGGKMQYPFKIENITVDGDRNYRFTCWIRTTNHFKSGIKLFMFTCYDKNGKVLGQPRKSVWFTNGEWAELVFDFTTPAGTEKMDIWFNMRHFPKEAEICIDQLRFEEGNVGPEMRQSFVPAEKTMTIACPVLGDLASDSVAKTTFTITNEKGETVKVIEDLTGKPLTMSVNEFADGVYFIKADVALKSGKVMSTPPRRFGIYKDPYWKNNGIGVIADSAPAPAPWKDLVLDGNTVRTWNVAYEFSPSLGITQAVDSNGNKLLKKPLVITVDGKAVEAVGNIKWTFGKARISGAVDVKGSNWNGKLTVLVDYIGFIRYALTVDAKSAVTLKSGKVDFALNEVEFIHRADASWSAVGSVDLTTVKKYATKHRYHEIMFGSVDRGLVWYAPQLYPAGNDFDQNVTVADINGDFQISWLNAPLSLQPGKSFKFEFAIASYPFRPAGYNWQRLRFRAGKNRNFDMMSSMKCMAYCGLPASRDDALTQKQLSSIPEGGVMTLYQIPFYITDFMPEFRYFESEWTGYPARYYNLRAWKNEPNSKMRKCDPRAELWHDLYCYMMQEYLKKFKWDGFYYDCYGSDLYSKNGVSMHPTFDVRRFHERVYLTGKAADPDFFTITHLGAQQACTSVPFTDVALMGEQYRAQCMLNDYVLDFLTLNEFRFENAVNTGADRMFLPQYRQEYKIQSPELAAHNVGLAFLHNNMLYPSFINGKVARDTQDRIFGFGLEKAEFFPYWKNNPDGIASSNDKIKVSYYKNEKGLMLIVFNSVKSKQQTKLTVPVKYTSAKVWNPVDDTETDLGDGSISLGEYLVKFVQITF